MNVTFYFFISAKGFGLTEKNSQSNKLKFAQINLRPPRFCENLSNKTLEIDAERSLCGVGRLTNSGVRRDSCQNDSGGPLVAKVLNESNEEKYTLVGIVSNGAGPRDFGKFSSCGLFGIYTKVSKYLNFIRDPVHFY